MTHCSWTPTAYLFPLMLLSFLTFRVQITDCLSIPTIKMMHNYCILWMEMLWTLKCHHSSICSSAVIYFPADSIQYTGTHNAEVSTKFITLISGCTTHAATDEQKQSGMEDLQSSPSPFRLCANFLWLRHGSSGKVPINGYVPVGVVLETEGCRGPLSERPSSLMDTTVHWFPPEPTSATTALPAPWEVCTAPSVSPACVLASHPFHWWGFLWMQVKLCLQQESISGKASWNPATARSCEVNDQLSKSVSQGNQHCSQTELI